MGSPRLLSTHMLDSSHELKETTVFSVWIMVPYNSENQDRVAHYNNENMLFGFQITIKIEVVLLPNNHTHRGGLAPN